MHVGEAWSPDVPQSANITMTQTQGDRVEEKCSLIWKKENFNALIAHTVCWMFVGGSRGVGAGWGAGHEALS